MKTKFENLELIQKNELITKAIDSSNIGIIITDPLQKDNPIVYANKGFETLTGYTSDEIIGRNCRFLQGKNTSDLIKRKMRNDIQNAKNINIVIENYKKDGTPFMNDLSIEPIYLKELQQTFFIGIQKDITKQITAEKENKRKLLDIYKLSTPIIPISEEIVVLPLVGDINLSRQKDLLDKASQYINESDKNYLILDLSGIEKFNQNIHQTIYSLQSILSLLGCQLILTGIKPSLAIATKDQSADISNIKSFSTVEIAIKKLNS